jgi:hypothetical protein
VRPRHAAGVLVTAATQPRLLALVAEAWEPPDEVSVSFALRAEFVELRRRRRALVLGLALFAVVSEEELRAVIRGDAAPARVEELAHTWEEYWLTHVVPALEAERRPPILEGFLATLPAGTPSAAELLDGVPALEAELMTSLSGRPLEPMAWSESAEVYLVNARSSTGDFAFVLEDLTAGELGEAVAGLDTLASAVHRKLPTVTREEAAEIAVHVLADGLAIALAGAGWALSADIDEPLRARMGDRELEPLDEVLGMTEGTHLPTAWAGRAQALGIADLPIGV